MELYAVLAVVNRESVREMQRIYEKCGCTATVSTPAEGTASGWQLKSLGLDKTEKALSAAVAVGRETRRSIFREAKARLAIDIPGNGLMMAVPLKSVGGGKTLALLTNNRDSNEPAPKMDFSHELIIAILNQGYTDDVMDAARAAGAGGGTVVHAKGTGASYARKFLGVSLADEKEIILIAAESGDKAKIMQAIAANCGPGTPSGAVTFSLPISAVTGIRKKEADD